MTRARFFGLMFNISLDFSFKRYNYHYGVSYPYNTNSVEYCAVRCAEPGGEGKGIKLQV